MSEIPEDVMKAAEEALDNLLCNCKESCGGTYEGVRAASILDIAQAIFAERTRRLDSQQPTPCRRRQLLQCPFCEGDPAEPDENKHTYCTNIACGSSAYMHVDAWNKRPSLGAYARIAELERELGGWLTIDDAPTDGTRVDLWVTFERTGSRRVTNAYWNSKVGDWQINEYNAADYVVRPKITHWMPLPAAPAKQEGGKSKPVHKPAVDSGESGDE